MIFTYGHRNVVRSVAGGLTRSGSVDGYVWEALSVTEPELTAQTKVIARSEWLGFPPMVARKDRMDEPSVQAMTVVPRFRDLPVTLRVPLVMAGLMVLLGFLASQSVLSALGRVQDARLSETARLHVEGLSVALGPSVLRQDVWEIYDILDRARSAYDSQRLLLSIVADERGRILAATDPRRAPVGDEVASFEVNAVPPDAIRMTGDSTLRVMAPLLFQGRQIGQIVTELDVTDLLTERRNVSMWLLFGNAAATAVLAFGGWLAVARILRPVGTLVLALRQPRAPFVFAGA